MKYMWGGEWTEPTIEEREERERRERVDWYGSSARLDYNLTACLENNPQPAPLDTPEGITHVLAVWEGENDGDSWRWVLALSDGRYAFVEGSCDYTGWDCQSSATTTFADDPESAALVSVVDEVRASLLRQVGEGKNVTWRERKDDELALTRGLVDRRAG